MKILAIFFLFVAAIVGLSVGTTLWIIHKPAEPPPLPLNVKVLTDKKGSEKLGAFTNITSTDRLTDFVAVYNANLSKTIETGTTSVSSITTLPNLTSAASLATVGTLTTGVWNGSPVTVPYGGTGSTTLLANTVLLGNGTAAMNGVASTGVLGQFLTSQGAGSRPIWTSASLDTTLDYVLTGGWTFPRATSTNFFSAYSSTTQAIVGALGVGTATTTQRNVEVAGNLQVGTCSGCTQVATSSASGTLSTGAGGSVPVTATCPNNSVAIGAGTAFTQTGTQNILTSSNATYILAENRAQNLSSWKIVVACANGGGCAAGDVWLHVMCATGGHY